MMNLVMGALFGFLAGLAMNQSPAAAKPSEDEEYFAAMQKWEARIHSAARWSVN